MRIKAGLFLPLGAVAALLLFPLGGVVADTFISGHRMFIDRVDDRNVSDNQILKYDATTNKWLPDSDDVGEDTSLPSNDTASATLRGNDSGDGWEQNTSLKSTSGGVVTLTGASAAITLEKGGSEAASVAADDLVIRDVDGSGADVGISILTDSDADAYSCLYFGSGTVENNSWIRAKDTYMDIRVDETTWVGATATLTTLKNDTNLADDKHFSFGTNEDIRFEYDEATDDRLEIHDGTNLFLTIKDAGSAALFTINGTFADDNEMKFGTDSDATIEYDENGTNQLRIDGATIFEDVVEFDSAINADAGMDIPDDITLDFGDSADVTIQFDANGNEDLEITGPVAISGASSFGSTLGITGVTTLTGGAKVPDDTTIAFGDLDTPDATIQYDEDGDNDLQITGNTSVVGTFGVSGNTAIGGTLGVTGTTTLGNLAAGGISVGNIASVGRFSSVVDTFDAADSTPSVGTGVTFLADNSGAVNISDLDDAVDGQIIIIIGTHNTNTCNFDASVQFYLSADHDLGAGDTLTLVYYASGDIFYELAYSDNTNS